jgi:hypothetical protein
MSQDVQSRANLLRDLATMTWALLLLIGGVAYIVIGSLGDRLQKVGWKSGSWRHGTRPRP